MAGDEEAGDDEEDIDADEPADEAVGPQVIEQNDSHSQSTQTLDVCTESRWLGCIARLWGGVSDRGCRLHVSAPLNFSVGWIGPDCGPCHSSDPRVIADSGKARCEHSSRSYRCE